MRRLHLTRLVLARDPARPFPGDPCPMPDCTGRIEVYTTRPKPDLRVVIRYLHCNTCGHKPHGNKWVNPE